MACAYIFALIALLAFPAAVRDSFAHGIDPQPIVQWLSQSFIQLVLLSIIMVGQKILSSSSDTQAREQHDAVLEILSDVQELVSKVHTLVLED